MKTPAVLLVLLLGQLMHSAVADQETGLEETDETRFQAVHFVTQRNLTGESRPEDRLGDERDRVRTGRCIVSHAPYGLLSMPEVFSRNGLVYLPENRIGLEAVKLVDSGQFWEDFAAARNGQRLMLYLHGYNTSFAKSCEQASYFQSNLGMSGRLLLFSWPSDGALLNYARDEADLFWSVAQLELTLQEMIANFGAGGFDVIGHSLGARGLVYAMVLLAQAQHDQLPLVNQLILTAPDIDADVFKQYLPLLRPLARNITLYVSDNDRPLALSREVHGYPRLGESGDHLDDIEGVQIIDVSDIKSRSFSGHLYHLYHDRVTDDLNLLVNQGVLADQRVGLSRQAPSRWRVLMP